MWRHFLSVLEGGSSTWEPAGAYRVFGKEVKRVDGGSVKEGYRG